MVAYKPLWVGRRGIYGQTALIRSIYEEVTTLEPMVVNLLEDYEELAGTPYVWEGLEEIDITEGHLESLFYWNTHIGIGEAEGEQYITGARPITEDLYGEPFEWTPVPTNVSVLPTNFIRKYDAEENPCIKVGKTSLAQRITDECVWQASTYISANQNVIGMRMPVVLTGTDNKTEMGFIEDSIVYGRSIPYLDMAGIQAEVHDLKAQNFLDPLSGYAEFIHNKTLGKLGIDALGTQKASGITQEEAILILAQIKGIRKKGLKVRERVCDMFNEVYGSNITVKENDIYLETNVGMGDNKNTHMDTMANPDDDKTKDK